MHPELERMAAFYLEARAAAASGRATVEDAINAVSQAHCVDAAGRTWTISSESPASHALFCVTENESQRLADPAEFAALPGQQAAPAPAAPAPVAPAPVAPTPQGPMGGNDTAVSSYDQKAPAPYAAASPGYEQHAPTPAPYAPAPSGYEQHAPTPAPYAPAPSGYEQHAQAPYALADSGDSTVRNLESGDSPSIIERLQELPKPAQIICVVVVVAVISFVMRPLYTGSDTPEQTPAGQIGTQIAPQPGQTMGQIIEDGTVPTSLPLSQPQEIPGS